MPEAIDNGTRRELLVDDYFIEKIVGARLVLHKPWEGNICGYHTIFRDGDLYRMYYRGSQG